MYRIITLEKRIILSLALAAAMLSCEKDPDINKDKEYEFVDLGLSVKWAMFPHPIGPSIIYTHHKGLLTARQFLTGAMMQLMCSMVSIGECLLMRNGGD